MKGVFRAAILLWLAIAGAACAQPVVDQVVTQLQQQGYTAITVTRTFLGRTRIQASSPTQSREIVLNAASGEILRDVWQQRSGSTSPGVSINPGAGKSAVGGVATGGGKVTGGRATGGASRAGRDHDDDDDDGGRGRGRGRGRGGDDDDRSDNSGRGSDNSGRGSGSSGSGSDGDDD